MLLSTSLRNKKNFLKNKNYNNSRKLSKLMWPKLFKPRYNHTRFMIAIPHNWRYVTLQNSSTKLNMVYIYSDTYYFYLSLPTTVYNLYIDNNTSVISFYSMYVSIYATLYWNFLSKTFSSFNKPFFNKVRFKGKGYYIFKNTRQTITPQFGHSHRLYLYAYYASVKFLSKTQIFIFGLLRTDIIKVSEGIKSMRPINIFTGRGVRFNRQIIYKKVGKVSSYR